LIVVDTNILAYLYIAGKYSEQAAALLEEDSDWCSSRLWRSEFRSVLSLYLRKEILSMAEVLVIISQAEVLLSSREYEVSSTSIMHLVQASSCSAYDCEFVALAMYLDVPLLTSDRKILREFPDVAASINNFIGR
jgi:predicted nucleic acid-binding protein